MNLKIETITDFSGRELDLAREIIIFWKTQPAEDNRTRFGTSHPPCEAALARLIGNFAVLCLAYDTDTSPATLIGHAEAGRLHEQPNWAEISVATDANYRHQGIGTRLLEATVASCISQGVIGIKAYVLPYNYGARSLINSLRQYIPIECKYRQDCCDLEYTAIIG